MFVKLFEIRDVGTFIPMISINLSEENEAERFLLSRAGYGKEQADHQEYILLASLNGGQINYDPFAWNDRTRHTAHLYIKERFDELEHGAVIDVQFILGETQEQKISEANA